MLLPAATVQPPLPAGLPRELGNQSCTSALPFAASLAETKGAAAQKVRQFVIHHTCSTNLLASPLPLGFHELLPLAVAK